MMEKKQNYRSAIFLAVILLITILAFSNSISNDFTNWDDPDYVVNNGYIKDFSWKGVKNMFTHFYASNYHPLTALTNAVEYKFFGLYPKPFHFFNLLLHLFNVVLVFYFIFLLTKRVEASVIVSVFFAIHPMHVESVAWVSERKDVLYSFFYLGSLIAYISPPLTPSEGRGKTPSPLGRAGVGLSLFLFLLSLLSKSAAVMLPLILLLLDYYLNGKLTKKNLVEKIPFFILSFIFGIIAFYSQKTTGAMEAVETPTLLDKIFLSSYAVCFYIFKMFLPIKLCVLHFYPEKINDWLSFQYYLSFPVIMMMIFGIYKSVGNRKDLIFGFFFFIINLALVLQFIPFGSAIVAERYTYLPYIGLFFILGQWYCKIDFLKKAKILLNMMLVSSVVIFSIITFNRNKVWKNGVVLFSDVIKKNHSYYFGYHARGIAKEKTNDYTGAIADYTEAIRLNSTYNDAYVNRGVVRGVLKDYTGAIADFTKAIQLNPNNAKTYFNRGSINGYLENYKEAINDFNTAIQIEPGFAALYYFRAMAKIGLEKTTEACDDLHRAIQLGYAGAEELIQKHCK